MKAFNRKRTVITSVVMIRQTEVLSIVVDEFFPALFNTTPMSFS